MLASTKIMKKTAKTALSGRWLEAIVAAGVFILVSMICELLSELFSIAATGLGGIVLRCILIVFVLLPLMMGLIYYYRRMLWGQSDRLSLIFRFFSSLKEYKRVLSLVMLIIAKLAVSSIILFLPTACASLLSQEWFFRFLNINYPVWATNMWMIGQFLSFIASVALFFISIKYYMAPFLLVCDEDMHSAEAVNMSEIISRRTVSEFFWLLLTFLGWILLSLLLIPALFTVPYILCTCLVHCRFAVAAYNKEVQTHTNSEMPHFETYGF